jgi:ribosome-binding protein aMBF1 (putative translation factor)
VSIQILSPRTGVRLPQGVLDVFGFLVRAQNPSARNGVAKRRRRGILLRMSTVARTTTRANSKTAQQFRDRMARLMKERGVTQVELAEAIGTKDPNISRILSGQEGVTLDRAERIAVALGVDVAEMLTSPQR